MKRITYITAFAFLCGCGDPAQHAAERALHEGAIPYNAADHVQAASVYGTALHDARVNYNLGNALYKQQLLDTAIHSYTRSIELAPTDSSTAMAQYNMGNGWALIALKADSASKAGQEQIRSFRVDGEDISRKVRSIVARDSLKRMVMSLEHLVDSGLTQSATAYRHALRQAPQDEDARYNLALVQARIAARVKEAERAKSKNSEQDQKLSERARLLMQQADELVDQYKFTQALKVLNDGLKAEPSLKQKQDYMNKLDVVTKAAQAK